MITTAARADSQVLAGVDRLRLIEHPMIDGKRLGLVTNPTGVTRGFESTVDVCAGLASAELTALFACEHGLHGQRQAGVLFGDEIDEARGIPIYSLYGDVKKPTGRMLENVDTVVFDIQDLGVRFYTYLSTLVYVMKACAEYGKSMLVLDRPNPLGGLNSEGGLLRPGYESMVGVWTMPMRTGMTIGELACMVNELEGIGCELDVIELEGWSRAMEYGDTGLPWMMPSPNMPSIDSVRTYAGTCLFEGTNVSEGRGTTRPFEWIGAPWIDGKELAARMSSYQLPGVHFHPVFATPTFSKHQGVLCGGLRLFITDKECFESVRTGLTLLHEVAVMYPEAFEWLKPPREGSRYFIDLLCGGDTVRHSIAASEGLQAIVEDWQQQTELWQKMRKPYLRYL